MSEGRAGVPHRVWGESDRDACAGWRSARFNDGIGGAVRGGLQGTAGLRRVHDGEFGDGALLPLQQRCRAAAERGICFGVSVRLRCGQINVRYKMHKLYH